MQSYIVAVSGGTGSALEVEAALSKAGLQVNHIIAPTIAMGELVIPRSLAEVYNELLPNKQLELGNPHTVLHKFETDFDNGACAALVIQTGVSSLWVYLTVYIDGQEYPCESIRRFEDRITFLYEGGVAYYLTIRVGEDPPVAPGVCPPLFYHFYEGNHYVGTAYGKTAAEQLLEDRKDRWLMYNDNFWSDGGDVEMSRHPLAPPSNIWSDMDEWRKIYPNWGYKA